MDTKNPTERVARWQEEKFGPEGYTVMDAVGGLAQRMREITGSVLVTFGRDRIESYALALERAAELLALLDVEQEVVKKDAISLALLEFMEARREPGKKFTQDELADWSYRIATSMLTTEAQDDD